MAILFTDRFPGIGNGGHSTHLNPARSCSNGRGNQLKVPAGVGLFILLMPAEEVSGTAAGTCGRVTGSLHRQTWEQDVIKAFSAAFPLTSHSKIMSIDSRPELCVVLWSTVMAE